MKYDMFNIIGVVLFVFVFTSNFGFNCYMAYTEYQKIYGRTIVVHNEQLVEKKYNTLIDSKGNEIPITPEISKKLI